MREKERKGGIYYSKFKTKQQLLQWNPSKTDTIGTKNFVRYSEVSLAQGLVVDHAPPTIAASYDKARLWMMKQPY